MIQKVRFGVIGAGWFASRRHIPDIICSERAELVALCRRDADALAQIAAHFSVSQTYTDWRKMLAECPLDAVVIATPHNLHYELAATALERGLHVLLEKPMTVHSEEARRLLDLAYRRKRLLSIALNPPFWAHCHCLRDSLATGAIGTVEAVNMFWTGNAEYVFGQAPPPADLPGVVPPTLYRADPDACGGGYLIDGGSHLISEVLWVTGLRAISVTCLMDATPSDRRAALSLQLENRAMVTLCSLGDSRHNGRRVLNTFAGTEGTITISGFDFETRLVPADPTLPSVTFQEKSLPPVASPVENLIDALTGNGSLFSPAEHGVHVVEVVEAAYRSVAEGRTISLSAPPVPAK